MVSVLYPLDIAETPVREISISPRDFIKSTNASILLGFPVSSKTKLFNVTSRVLALKVSAILKASTLSNPEETTFTKASSLLMNGPSSVKSLTR